MRTQNQSKARERKGIESSSKAIIIHPDGTVEELVLVWEASLEDKKVVDAPTFELD